jgi:hypothetical protein
MKHFILWSRGKNVPHDKRNGKFDRLENGIHKKTLEMISRVFKMISSILF